MDSPFDTEISKVKDAALKAMWECILMIQADTQQLCPVKTGTLKRSYTSDAEIDGEEIVGTVGSNVEYAIWADMKQPHLTAAVDQNMEKVKNKFTEILKQRE